MGSQKMIQKVCLITGAAGGIGRALARVLIERDFALTLVDRDEASVNDLQNEINERSLADQVICRVSDCADEASMNNIVSECVRVFGRLDSVILNAGIEGPAAYIESTPVDEFDEVMRINVRGPFLGIKASFEALKSSGGGTILITSSTSGVVGAPGLCAYTTSKHAIVGLMRCAAIEGAPRNIRVNTVHPGPVETRMMHSLEESFSPGNHEKAKQDLIALIPMSRYAKPEEVANLFSFLASDEANYITGQTYYLDGGMLAGQIKL